MSTIRLLPGAAVFGNDLLRSLIFEFLFRPQFSTTDFLADAKIAFLSNEFLPDKTYVLSRFGPINLSVRGAFLQYEFVLSRKLPVASSTTTFYQVKAVMYRHLFEDFFDEWDQKQAEEELGHTLKICNELINCIVFARYVTFESIDWIKKFRIIENFYRDFNVSAFQSLDDLEIDWAKFSKLCPFLFSRINKVVRMYLRENPGANGLVWLRRYLGSALFTEIFEQHYEYYFN
jgi:hypothetical protein